MTKNLEPRYNEIIHLVTLILPERGMRMFTMMTNNIPQSTQKELEKLFSKLTPLMKKNAKYMMFAVPLLIIAFTNFIFFIFLDGFSEGMLITAIVYAVMAAIGMALFKETKYLKKEIKEIELEHVIGRIKDSDIINDYRKKNYTDQIKSEPKLAIQTFISFLQEENERKKIIEN